MHLVKQSRSSPHETLHIATNATLNPDEKTTGATIKRLDSMGVKLKKVKVRVYKAFSGVFRFRGGPALPVFKP